MNIGYAQEVITPSLERPVYLAGFAQNRCAKSIHDDLYARAVAISSDEEQVVVLCALDLIGFFRVDVVEVIEGVQAEAEGKKKIQIVLASTHTHDGPDTMGLWGPDDRTSGVDSKYMAMVKEKAKTAILAAVENLEPCSGMKAATVHFPGLAKNARDPEIVDDELAAAQFLNKKGEVVVTITNYPCHPEVLWEDNKHVSSDYPCHLRKEVERLTGAPCTFFSADLGGMLTPEVKDHSFEEADFMGKALALSAVEGLAKTQVVPAPFDVSLQKKELDIKLTNLLFKVAMRRGLFPDSRDRKGMLHSEVNLVKIDGLWLATIPGELLPKLGLRLRAAMLGAGAEVTGVIGLANDELGYLLPKEDFHYPLNPLKPGEHYEETMSVSKEAGETVTQAVEGLLPSKKGGKKE